jgi:hypothetical protein
MASRFRLLYPWMIPGWLYSGDGGKVVHALATVVDAVVERTAQGRDQRFPSRANESALAELGYDRGLVRGRSESASGFAARLPTWRYPRGHRVRGSAFALLEQIATYLGGVVTSWTIDASGTRHDRASDGNESYSYGNAWTWDSVAASEWGRFWVNVYSPSLTAQEGFGATLWGGSLGAPEHALGISGMTEYDANALRGLMRGRHPWRPAGTTGQWLVVSTDGTEPSPDATWARWGKLDGTDYIPSRVTASGDIDQDLSAWTQTLLSVVAVAGGYEWRSTGSGTTVRSASDTGLTIDTGAVIALSAEPGTLDWIYVSSSGGANNFGAWINTSTGAVGSTIACSVTVDGAEITIDPTDADVTTLFVRFVDADGSANSTAAGAGVVLGTVHFVRDAVSAPHRFIALTSSLLDYPGDETVFAETIVPAALGPFDGDPTSFPATITLPDGTSYAGDPASFPSTIALVDDGD